MSDHAPSHVLHQNNNETPVIRNRTRSAAIRALYGDGSMVYAMRLKDGTIKIGCSTQLHKRRRNVGASAEILGFMPGTLEDETGIHASLVDHRARGVEYYHPAAVVMAVVNEMRDHFNLPHLSR